MSGSLDDLENMLRRIEHQLRQSLDLSGPSAVTARDAAAGFANIGATGALATATQINELVEEIAALAGSARQKAEDAIGLITMLRT